jgi:hypothetical protein
MTPNNSAEWLAERIERFTGERPSSRPAIFDDTSRYMYIDRGDVIALDGELFLVRGNAKEGRFGIDEQPKFWVKRAISMTDGRPAVLKLVCHEAFKVQIGAFEITCRRSGDKEAQVLDLVRGDRRFMQGRSARDCAGNLVRAIDFIDGRDLLSDIDSLRMGHEEYFRECFPSILARTLVAFGAIDFLNAHGLCHGDIRNDHILVERGTGAFRWIDFDLTEDFVDFDLWSLGNILHCIVGKGFVTFRDAVRDRPGLSGMLNDGDASVFFPHRVMNLAAVYPYVPRKLNLVLLRFSRGARTFYDSVSQLVEDLGDINL